MKAEGKLVGDRQVVELLFEALLRPEYQVGRRGIAKFESIYIAALCVSHSME
jgi:hypothetical protein